MGKKAIFAVNEQGETAGTLEREALLGVLKKKIEDEITFERGFLAKNEDGD
jgi:hypothetical protein